MQLVVRCIVQCTPQSDQTQLPSVFVSHRYTEINTWVHEHILHQFSIVVWYSHNLSLGLEQDLQVHTSAEHACALDAAKSALHCNFSHM